MGTAIHRIGWRNDLCCPVFWKNLLDEFFASPISHDFWNVQDLILGKQAKNLVKSDAKEEEDAYGLTSDLPDFEKENVQIHLEDRHLTITVEKSGGDGEMALKGYYIRQERYSDPCGRSFHMGDIRLEDGKCSYRSGVFHMHISKWDMQLAEKIPCSHRNRGFL